jgi:hypothetical protein
VDEGTVVLSTVGKGFLRGQLGLACWSVLVYAVARPEIVGARLRLLPLLATVGFASAAALLWRQQRWWRLAATIGYASLAGYYLSRLGDPYLTTSGRHNCILYGGALVVLALGLALPWPIWVSPELANLPPDQLNVAAPASRALRHSKPLPPHAVRFGSDGPRRPLP